MFKAYLRILLEEVSKVLPSEKKGGEERGRKETRELSWEEV